MDKGYAARMARWRVPLGMALGVFYLVFAQPTPRWLLAGSLVALAGLGVRARAAGYLDKNDRLATGGPYSHTRNPLYLGSFFIGVGLAVEGGRWILGVAFLIFFFIVYIPVMRREAASLHERFGDAYERYAEHVPLFVPRLRRGPDGAQFLWTRYLKNREYEAALGYAAAVVFLALKMTLR